MWVSWIALNAGNAAAEGVAAFNLRTQTATLVYQVMNAPTLQQADDPYPSAWCSALNGVMLTEWNDGYDGYVGTLDANENCIELHPSFSP